MKSRIRLVKLDKRYAGYPTWAYFVEKPYTVTYNYSAPVNVNNPKELFLQWRTWCWETWGPSKELQEYDYHDLFDGLNCSNAHWCWLHDVHRPPRLYFKTDADASAFALQWL